MLKRAYTILLSKQSYGEQRLRYNNSLMRGSLTTLTVRQPPTSARDWLFLNSKNAKNGLVFSWRSVLPGFLGRTNLEGREDTERPQLMMRRARTQGRKVAEEHI